MNNSTQILPVIRLAGLHLDTLGHYFAALGILRLSAREWPTIKGCWRDGVFCLVGGPDNFAELEGFLLEVGENEKWTEYQQEWGEDQKRSSEIINKSLGKNEDKKIAAHREAARILSFWENNTDEKLIPLYLSHIVSTERRSINPLFKNYGGKRNYPNGWKEAKKDVSKKIIEKECLESEKIMKKANKAKEVVFSAQEKIKKAKNENARIKAFTAFEKAKNEEEKLACHALEVREKSRSIQLDLSRFLSGESCKFLSSYNAGSWFSAANKIYNFSPDESYCNGQITPWAILLACESFSFFVGSVSRKIGSRRIGTGAFPFTTTASAPETEKENNEITCEFWAPVWNYPLSVPEVVSLFNRSRAEVNGKGALTSAAFSVAIMQRGIDAGLSEFRRFSLFHTTSTKTVESRLGSTHSLANTVNSSQTLAVSRIIHFRDNLPHKLKRGGKWVYSGVQGPVDNALVRLAASGKNDELRVDSSWQLLDAVFFSFEKTANNKTYREREPALELLPLSWVISLLENTHEITTELKIALALATLKPEAASKTSGNERKNDQPAPLIAYRVGVGPTWESNWRAIKIAKTPPQRVVWSQRGLADNLCAILHRRIAVESDANREPPCNAQLSLSLADILSFLNKETDDALIVRWLNRFMLFNWHFINQEERKQLSVILHNSPSAEVLLPEEMLYAFLRPLFHAYTFERLDSNNIYESRKIPTANALRPLIALLERGDSAAAYLAAVNRYKSLLQTTAYFGDNAFAVPEPRRLLASLLLPANPASIINAFTRWTIPANKQQAR